MITKLKLENFKIFQSQDFKIAPFTLITGINGMGKSSIIQSLLLLKQSYVTTNLLQAQPKVDLANDFINLESAENLCYGLAPDNEKNVSIEIDDSNFGIHKWIINASTPKLKVLDCVHTGADNFQSISLFSEDFIYLDAERWGPREIYSRKKEKRTFNTKLGIQGELTPSYLADAISPLEYIGISEMKHQSLDDSLSLYENVNAWMSDVLSFPIKARTEDIGQDRIKLSYNMEGARGGSYSALQVGFGITFCLPVIVAALRAKKGDLIIVENPEAHLHPSAQVKIGLLLAVASKNGVQIIMESHSDHILNSVRFAFREGILNNDLLEILFIRNTKNGETTAAYPDYVNVLERGKLDHRPPDFFDVWDNMLTKLL